MTILSKAPSPWTDMGNAAFARVANILFIFLEISKDVLLICGRKRCSLQSVTDLALAFTGINFCAFGCTHP